jgi:radical SAM superfamily enzyme YgiQ (UPF0313 family)
MTSKRLRIAIVQQGVWDTPLESMPLAAGYLRANAEADPRLAGRIDVRIHNFRGGDRLAQMAHDIFRDGMPDVLAFSVLGWNFSTFGALAETFRRGNGSGWVIFGGTHVANQAARVFRLHPSVDVVVNGEGEFVFTDLLAARLRAADICDLDNVNGISFRNRAGEIVTTAPRARIQELDEIPSPILTGAIPLTGPSGAFRYDVALMETNRGCPYQCSFCYWGGATGQKVRTFSMERLLEEVELFARHEVETLILCDANFAMLPRDKEFVEGVLEVRQRYGFPHSLESSWAKNKSDTFYEIVKHMTEAGLKTSFTLALQTLNDDALTHMHRRNMRVNAWEDLVDWLDREGLESYAELIWGAPGETVESFVAGYDAMAERVSRIATYPLLLLPNTRFTDEREDHGFVTVRGDTDDFEYVLEHNTMTMDDNRQMMRFIFWARSIAENMYLRHIWAPLRRLAGVKQSEVIWSVADFFDEHGPPGLRACEVPLVDSDVVGRTIKQLHTDPQVTDLFRTWWQERMRPRLPKEMISVLGDILEYDLLTRPVYDAPGHGTEVDLPVESFEGESHYVRDVELRRDVPAVLAAVEDGKPLPEASPVHVRLAYKVGFYRHCDSTEAAAHFYGKYVLIEPGDSVHDRPTKVPA